MPICFKILAVLGLWGFSCALADIPADLARASTLLSGNSPAEARSIYEQMLPSVRSSGDDRYLGQVLRGLSDADLAQGKLPAAIEHGRECVTAFRKLGLPAEEVYCLTVIGRAHVLAGDYVEALSEYDGAVAIARAKGISEALVTLLNNTGNVYYFQGKYADADRSYRDAMQEIQKYKGEPWYARRLRLTLANRATLLQRLGQYQRALEIYGELRALPGKLSQSEETQLLVNMGALYRRLGDSVKALDTYRTAEALFRASGNIDGVVRALINEGIALALGLNNLSAALQAFSSAVKLAEKTGDRREAAQADLYAGETLYRLRRYEEARASFSSALEIANDVGLPEERWKALYGLGRVAASGADTAHASEQYGQAIRIIESLRSGISAPSQRIGFLADKRDVYDAELALLVQQPNPPLDRILTLMENARSRYVRDKLGSSSSTAVTLAKLKTSLDPSTLIALYWETRDRGAVLWITNSQAGLADTTGAELSEPELIREMSTGTGEQWRDAAAKVGGRLMMTLPPIAQRAVTRFIVVPDGLLQLIPFEVLTIGGTGAHVPALEALRVSYASSAGAIVAKRPARAAWYWPWQRMLIGFGDPIGGPETEALSSSRQELESISARVGRSELHLGADNLKRYLTSSAMNQAPVLHISSHAVADANDWERSRIMFSPSTPNTGPDFLYARELVSMNLTGVELATLSACDTEQGQAVEGEGVIGLGRAFLGAGARSTVSTLWRVGDQSTSEFMTRFYSRLSKGEAAATALRDTKLDFYRSGSNAAHPWHWAAFILSGDPEMKLPYRISWTLFWASTLLLGAGATYGAAKIGKWAASKGRTERKDHVAVVIGEQSNQLDRDI